MSERWKRKKEKRAERKRQQEKYTWADVFGDIFFWIPELFFLPFRLLFWILRGLVRALGNLFDGI
ncbi:hypothetical protein H9650_10640 [Psychrobacillus sp. Sa2BUA9]|uniref:YqzE family protein n=1 Tax=Psychrobacillus faecigallinarum TaxID=2762235 RepID=A0ABR8R9V5_9BACI|nr:hypothetical protein [Psychrobacillus faecigallinarum]MBD7944573.1 hypothetical protein [Psychrobacillus faecigallinarum]